MRLFITVLIILLAAGKNFAADSQVTVGDPSHPEDLQRTILAAYEEGSRQITITPGVYKISSALAFTGLQDLVLSAYHVELSVDSADSGAVVFDKCHGVSFKGATLHYSAPHTGQARILATGKDDEGDFCDLQLEPGYPDNNGFKICGLIDGKTLLPKADGNSVRTLTPSGEPGKVRLRWIGEPGWKKLEDKSTWAVPGDYLVSRGSGGMMFYAKQSDHCTFEDISIYWGGIFGFFESHGCSSNRFIRDNITYGPIPPGGTMRPLASQSADGLHSIGSIVGPDMENCFFEGQMDDGVNIHGSMYQIAQTNGKVLTLGVPADQLAAPREYAPGDRIELYDIENKALVERKIVTVGASSFTSSRQSRYNRFRDPVNPMSYVDLTLDEAVGMRFDSVAWFPNYCGGGFKIIGCTVRNSWSRGLLLKAERGVVRDNLLEGCVASGIVVSIELNWTEAGFARDLTISGNTLRNCAFMCVGAMGPQAGGLVITATGMQEIGHRNITISGNTFENINLTNLVVRWARDVKISGNRFVNAFQRPNLTGPIGRASGIDPEAVVWIGDSDQVALKDNQLINAGAYATKMLSVASTARDVTGSLESKDPRH